VVLMASPIWALSYLLYLLPQVGADVGGQGSQGLQPLEVPGARRPEYEGGHEVGGVCPRPSLSRVGGFPAGSQMHLGPPAGAILGSQGLSCCGHPVVWHHPNHVSQSL
jgi:hypothetical protein